jgi:hypothetical protein
LELDTKNSRKIMHILKPIWFYWDGPISESRLQILKDAIYSTRVFNPYHYICLISNTLNQNDFDPKYYINTQTWSESFFEDTPIPHEKVEKYMKANPRDFSDLFRLILLYKYGGTYIDTDDLCIKPLSFVDNIVCRSYDPHTSFYNKITDDQCVPGFIREIEGYEHIPMFPRNDCWQNWNKNHPFIKDMLTNTKFQNNEDVVWIGGEFSWQSIANETCIKWLPTHGVDWNFRLTLLYLFEDFVAHSSYWDKCHHGGEMCDIWNKLPHIDDYEWGEYKCTKEVGKSFYDEICKKYDTLSHLWLHSKDMKQEWLEEIDETKLYSPSTWILNEVKKKIYDWE